MGTFSDIAYRDHNQYMLDISMASKAFLTSWRNIIWSLTPTPVQRPPIMMNQLHYSTQEGSCLLVDEVNSTSLGGALHNVFPFSRGPVCPLHTFK